MPTAYLIATYHSPQHVGRLMDALRTERSAFFVHVDRKVDLEPFLVLRAPDVEFTSQRFAVYWGEFSFIKAILTLIRQALASARNCDRFVFLSGAEYPLYSGTAIQDFLERNARTEFMNLVRLPADHLGKPLTRLTEYRIPSDASARLLRRILRKAQTVTGLVPRRRDFEAALQELQPYGGSTWWALTRDACLYIDDFVRNRVDVVDFFRNTLVVDEMLFHTILGNSPLRENLKRNLTYTRWRATESPNPEYLDETDLALFRRGPLIADDAYGRGELLFARKFSDASAPLIDELARIVATRGAITTG